MELAVTTARSFLAAVHSPPFTVDLAAVMTDTERAELLRRATLENAIASGELEGIEYTAPMRDLLERASRGEVTEAAFEREALAIARAGES